MDKLIITSGCSYTGAIGSGPPTPEVEGLPDWSHLSDEKALKNEESRHKLAKMLEVKERKIFNLD